MRKTILTAAGSALIVLSAVQFAAAAEHHRAHRADRATAATSEQFRNSNAAVPVVQPDWNYGGGYYYGGGMSAPAGR
jgi:opacity protein-like surface antigen